MVMEQSKEEGRGDGGALQCVRADLARRIQICGLRVVAR